MNHLLQLLSPVRRIRGNRLYLQSGQRLLDMWMDDGRLILGEEARHARLYAANAADKGLAYAIPGMYEQRLRKALRQAWPDYQSAALYLNEERALAAHARIVGTNPPVSEIPPLVRPFSRLESAGRFALLRFPCPQPFAPACLLIRDIADAGHLAGDIIPPLMQLAATRALDSLATCERNGYSEDWWQKIGGRLDDFFDRNGPYLYPKNAVIDGSAAYSTLFKAALAGNVLLSPDPDRPSIIPAQLDESELRRLLAVLRAWQAKRTDNQTG